MIHAWGNVNKTSYAIPSEYNQGTQGFKIDIRQAIHFGRQIKSQTPFYLFILRKKTIFDEIIVNFRVNSALYALIYGIKVSAFSIEKTDHK